MSFACSGGILADQMGLGKTIMSLALILSDPGQQYTLRNSVSEKCELENEWEFDNPFLPSEVTRTAGTLIVTRASLL
jgi:SNF2 family DNA or RNA helicase